MNAMDLLVCFAAGCYLGYTYQRRKMIEREEKVEAMIENHRAVVEKRIMQYRKEMAQALRKHKKSNRTVIHMGHVPVDFTDCIGTQDVIRN